MSYGLRMAARIALVVILALLIVNFLPRALAQSVGPVVGDPSTLRLTDVCPGYTVSRSPSKNEVYIRCPPRKDPWLTIRECAQPVVVRQPDGVSLHIECTKPLKA